MVSCHLWLAYEALVGLHQVAYSRQPQHLVGLSSDSLLDLLQRAEICRETIKGMKHDDTLQLSAGKIYCIPGLLNDTFNDSVYTISNMAGNRRGLV